MVALSKIKTACRRTGIVGGSKYGIGPQYFGWDPLTGPLERRMEQVRVEFVTIAGL